MKLVKILATSAVITFASVSALAQSAVGQMPVRDGSNNSRAPLPASRPASYNSVTKATNATVSAKHIGSPSSTQLAASNAAASATIAIYTPVQVSKPMVIAAAL